MVEVQHVEPALSTLDDRGDDGVNDTRPHIEELFQVPERYLRSVHLERDFDDPGTLRHYVMTPAMSALFSRVLSGLQPGAGHRAWRVTGDYGTGKSSFALILAQLLSDPSSPVVKPIRKGIDGTNGSGVLNEIRMLPVLVTGAREPIVPAIAGALSHSLRRLGGQRRRSRAIKELEADATAVVLSGDHTQLLDLLDRVSSHAVERGWSGVLLVLDELGKFLEYAALRPDREDVYILQRLAERAAKNSGPSLAILGLLHQGFHSYAESLPSVTRQEWEKVAGRYDEITFLQPLSHVTALVSEALNIDRSLVPLDVKDRMHSLQAATLETGWYGPCGIALAALDIYPLHPTVLPVLVRFFARFGQHERSLFSFLLSSEPFGLQSFALRTANGHSWYRLSDFYDYIRSTFGYRLAESGYGDHWLRMTETIDRLSDMDDLQLAVLKAVTVLNVLDAEHLLPTETVLAAALTDGYESSAVSTALSSLKRCGLLFDRGTAGGYTLWPSTSVNLVSAFEAAKRALGPVDRVDSRVSPFLDQRSAVARRHYIVSGTLRYFEIRYADSATLLETMAQPTEADGLVLVALCDSADERSRISAMVSSMEVASHAEIIVAVPPPLRGIATEVLDAECWQWIADNTPELNQDSYAAAEVARQLSASRRALTKTLDSLVGIRGEHATEVEWWHRGRILELPVRVNLSALLSDICDELYHDAPLINNELLNRRNLTSAASSARMRLIERMFDSSDKPSLGIDQDKAPPEKSMYLSVLSAGNVHREESGRFLLAEPPEDADPLHLRPTLRRILELLEQAEGRRVQVTHILEVLQSRPYGLRAGVAPFLLSIALVARSHEIAVYENGTFIQQFNAHDFLRLTKQPSAFEVQLCRVTGVRMEVFRLLARHFADERRNDRDFDLLDVVRPLSVFAAQLPEYTRRGTTLSDPAKSVRDALLTAREPATLIFEALPVACGVESFPIDGPADVGHENRFVEILESAVGDLQADYPRLLESIRDRVAAGLSLGGPPPDRVEIAHRASRVLLAAREPKIQTFARTLADAALSDDSWAERIGSFIASKPPSRWTERDRTAAMDEIDLLAGTFNRTEATAFGSGTENPDVTAMRISITGADGNEYAQITKVPSGDESFVQSLTEQLRTTMNGTERVDLRLAAIAHLLRYSLMNEAKPNDGAERPNSR